MLARALLPFLASLSACEATLDRPVTSIVQQLTEQLLRGLASC
jgi:hypothetical protein